MKKIYVFVLGLSLKGSTSNAMEFISPIYTVISTGVLQQIISTDEQKKESLNELHKIASTGNIQAVRNYIAIIRGGYRAQQEGAKDEIIMSLKDAITEWDHREQVTIYRLKKINRFKSKCEESLSFLSTLLEKEKNNGSLNVASIESIEYAKEVVNNLKKNADGIKYQIYTYTGEGNIVKRTSDSIQNKIERLRQEGTIFKQEPENQYEILYYLLQKNTPEYKEIDEIARIFTPLKNLKEDDSIVLKYALTNDLKSNKKIKFLPEKKEKTNISLDLSNEVAFTKENTKKLLNDFHIIASNGDVQSVKNHIAAIRGKYRGQKIGEKENMIKLLNNKIMEWKEREKIAVYRLTAISNFKSRCEESLSFLRVLRQEEGKKHSSSNGPSVKSIDYAREVITNLKNNADGIRNQIYTYKGKGSLIERTFFSGIRKINRLYTQGTIYKKELENQYTISWDFLTKNTPEYKEVFELDELFKPLKSLMGDDSRLLEKLRNDHEKVLPFIPQKNRIESTPFDSNAHTKEREQKPPQQEVDKKKMHDIKIENNIIVETSGQLGDLIDHLQEDALDDLNKHLSFDSVLEMTNKKKSKKNNKIEYLSKSLDKN